MMILTLICSPAYWKNLQIIYFQTDLVLNEWGDFKLRQASDSQILYDRPQIENCFLKNWFVTIISKLLTLASKYCCSYWINFLGYLISKMWNFTAKQWLDAEGNPCSRIHKNLTWIPAKPFVPVFWTKNLVAAASTMKMNKRQCQTSESSLSLYDNNNGRHW